MKRKKISTLKVKFNLFKIKIYIFYIHLTLKENKVVYNLLKIKSVGYFFVLLEKLIAYKKVAHKKNLSLSLSQCSSCKPITIKPLMHLLPLFNHYHKTTHIHILPLSSLFSLLLIKSFCVDNI